MAKITGAGAALAIGTADDAGATAPGSDTFTDIGNVRSFTGPNGEKTDVDVTDLASTAREFLGGLPDNGEVSFQGWHNESEATQTTLWGDYNDATDSHVRNYQITFSDGTVLDFKGYVKALAHNADPDGGVELNGSVRVTSSITRTLS